MKIVHINTFPNKSTGTIMMNIHKFLLKNDIESFVVWGRGRGSNNEREIFLNDKLGTYYHGLYTRLTDKTGFASKKSTRVLLKKLDEIKPEIVHLHNLHGYYINIELLFNYLKKKKIRIIWTLHDCWTFTGHCTHFEYANCEKWKNKCLNCPLINKYPKSFKDNSEWNYVKKKDLFNGLNITIVTPSKWLTNLVKQSFLKKYETIVIPNGINTDLFKPTKSDFRKKNHLENKKIILGVASEWTKEKGYDDFIKLSQLLEDDYRIVLVGLSEKQMKDIPKNILGIRRTESVQELVEIYSAADIYFNLTYADNYPTTNLEALACGTPVVTYKTGGSPECINGKNGIVIDFETLCKNYKKIVNRDYEINQVFNLNDMLDLYNKVYLKEGGK